MVAPKESPTPAIALRSCFEPSAIVLAISGSIARAGIPGLCERVRALLEANEADLVICDVEGLDRPDAVAVDALARLQLIAGRLGRRILLMSAGDDLQELLALTGLSDVVPMWELALESRGKAKEGEEGGRAQEERDPADPST